MKSTIIRIIIGIVTIVALAAAAGYFLGLLPLNQQPGNGEVKSPPTPSPTVPPPSTSPTVPPPSPSPTVPLTADVKFELVVSDVSGTGLSRTITAQITNTGSSEAHNVWVKIEVSSQEARVKLDGQDYIRVDLGTIKAKETVTRQVTLNISAFDGLKIAMNGAQFVLTIYSDEHTQTLSYDYKP